MSQCSEKGADYDDCGEQMLDTETQQAFAPQAITFFTPTVDMSQGEMENKVFEQYVLEFFTNTSNSEVRPQVVSLSGKKWAAPARIVPGQSRLSSRIKTRMYRV